MEITEKQGVNTLLISLVFLLFNSSINIDLYLVPQSLSTHPPPRRNLKYQVCTENLRTNCTQQLKHLILKVSYYPLILNFNNQQESAIPTNSNSFLQELGIPTSCLGCLRSWSMDTLKEKTATHALFPFQWPAILNSPFSGSFHRICSFFEL